MKKNFFDSPLNSAYLNKTLIRCRFFTAPRKQRRFGPKISIIQGFTVLRRTTFINNIFNFAYFQKNIFSKDLCQPWPKFPCKIIKKPSRLFNSVEKFIEFYLKHFEIPQSFARLCWLWGNMIIFQQHKRWFYCRSQNLNTQQIFTPDFTAWVLPKGFNWFKL